MAKEQEQLPGSPLENFRIGEAGTIAVSTAVLSSLTRRKILFYLGLLTILVTFGDPNEGLIDIPLSFFLKNKLNLEAHELANFRLVSAIPLFLSFVFGFVRDTWNPFGLGDKGFFMLFGAISAVLYIVFAFAPISYLTLLVAFFLLTSSYLFIDSAYAGLSSTLGQQHIMSGQISAVWNTFGSLPTIAALLIGGRLSDMLEGELADRALKILFLLGAAIFGTLVVYGAWKPESVFENLRAEKNPDDHLRDHLKRLARHWPIYPALTIWLLFNFAPGSSTPLQYYLQNTLHAEDRHWGEWNAIYTASFIPAFLVYGILCRRAPLRTLIWWGTIITIPQFVPLLFVHSVTGALLAAAPIGLMGGIANAAYLDLIIRSCPSGLQGTTLMLSGALYYVADRFGDVLGTNLYEGYGGFSACVTMITVVYALILPVLLFVPKELIAYSDGEVPNHEAVP